MPGFCVFDQSLHMKHVKQKSVIFIVSVLGLFMALSHVSWAIYSLSSIIGYRFNMLGHPCF